MKRLIPLFTLCLLLACVAQPGWSVATVTPSVVVTSPHSGDLYVGTPGYYVTVTVSASHQTWVENAAANQTYSVTCTLIIGVTSCWSSQWPYTSMDVTTNGVGVGGSLIIGKTGSGGVPVLDGTFNRDAIGRTLITSWAAALTVQNNPAVDTVTFQVYGEG